MKVTSLRYLDAKFHHPSLGASPPVAPYRICLPLQNCYNSCISCSRSALRYDSINSNLMNYSWTNGRLAIPSTSWASCDVSQRYSIKDHGPGGPHYRVSPNTASRLIDGTFRTDSRRARKCLGKIGDITFLKSQLATKREQPVSKITFNADVRTH